MKAGDIVKAVLVELSQVPGIATQVYAADRVLQYVQDAFLLEIEEMWWPEYMQYFGPIALDGVTGIIVSDLVGPISSITQYGDIAKVWPEGSNVSLKQLPPNTNPTVFVGGTGGGNARGAFMSADYTTPNRPFRVWPMDSTGNVVVWARQRNTLPLGNNDLIHIDSLLIQYDAAWMYCVDDGTVPAQCAKYQGLAQQRRKQVKSAANLQPLPLDARYPADTNQWWVAP
jgi:hypothetical protein